MNKVLSGLAVLVLMASSGAVGFYYGSKTSPTGIGISTLAGLVYDQEAEARFNAEIEVLDARLAEKEVDLAELEQENLRLEDRVINHQFAIETTQVEFEVDLSKSNEEFEVISNELIDSLEGNRQAQNKIDELSAVHISNLDLIDDRLSQANSYITVLEEVNVGLLAENTLTKSINEALMNQNNIMRDRIEDISGSRIRHGPGYAVGLNPVDNYQLTMLVGWTVSWG